ncbi:MAG TPA: M48 family metallopeptidase [Elusimicrobiota bacterium]|nr:M48 family metallopeptidase [Elusimicrobiota bacterium]HNC73949.1 M48 family metallopeptidase [Elusimicrobiota bacterium]HND63880.1 M48 family metallopeptidase [Elusimicrobiota bacterium]HNF58109.1 M48 family metallopeptidase [Elusimicrobiota bacterium]
MRTERNIFDFHRIGRLGAAALLAAVGCLRNPITQKREAKLISDRAEREIGLETKKKIIEEYGELKDPVFNQYVSNLGRRLASLSDRPKLDYQFTVLDTDVVNAFAAPGGFIFVTRGLLEQVSNEAELASVLAHEIGHVAGWHSIGMIQKQMGLGTLTALGAIASGIRIGPEAMIMVAQTADLFAALYLLGYSRENELEADRVGLRYMSSAGYDAGAALAFFKKLEALEKKDGPDRWESYLRSHPPTGERIAQAQAFLDRWTFFRRPRERGEGAYLEMKARLPRLAAEEQGRVEGAKFDQPLYGVALTVPDGWSWEPQSGRAIAAFRRRDGEAWGELRREALKDPLTAEAYARKFVADRKGQWLQGREVLYPAGYGYLAQFYGPGLLGGTYQFRGFFTVRDGAGWALLCAAVPDRALEHFVAFEQIQRSFELK